MKKPKIMMKHMMRIKPVIVRFSTITGPGKMRVLEANDLEKFDESSKHVELKHSEDIPGEVEDVKNVDVISTAQFA